MVAIFAINILIVTADLPPAMAVLMSDLVVYLLPMALVVGLGIVLSLSTVGVLVEHRFWTLLTVATALVLVAESYWTYYAVAVDHRGPPIDSPIRLVLLAAAGVFLSIGVTVTRYAEEPVMARLGLYVNVLAAMTVLYPAVFLVWIWPSFSSVPERLETAAIAAVYPVLGALVLGVAVVLVVSWKAYHWRVWERLITVSLVVYAVGLCAFPLWYPAFVSSQSLETTWFPWVMGCGFYLMFMAMVYRVTAGADDAVSQRWPVLRLEGAVWTTVFPAAMACAMVVLGGIALSLSGQPQGVPVLVSAILLAVLLGARSWLLELERGYHRKSSVTDHATGAMSRRHLDSRLEQAIADAGGSEMALVVFDIDGFARFEDQDDALAVLVEVAEVLTSVSGENAEVFRLGADQFAVIAKRVGGEQAAAMAEQAIATVRSRILETLGTLVVLCAGVAVHPLHAEERGALLEAAREACRAAKGTLGGEVRIHGAMPPLDDGLGLGRIADSRVRAGRDTVIVLAAAVDARDSVTRNHSAGAAELMGPLCRSLGLPEERVQMAALAALVHDVGKIGIPDSVLQKIGPLTPDERLLIQEHSELGERILAAARLTEILPIARHHHERWDGRGYPDGLEGHDIPIEARALAVCDTFETLIAGRPYRAAQTVEDAIAEVEANAGSQFDPMVAAVFVRMIRRELALGGDGQALSAVLRASRESA